MASATVSRKWRESRHRRPRADTSAVRRGQPLKRCCWSRPQEGALPGRLIVLNRTPERSGPRSRRRRPTTTCRARTSSRAAAWSGAAWQFFTHLSLSSLTRRIIFLNVAGLRRAGDRHSLSVAVPRRPDRRPHPEPDGAGRDHRQRGRRVGDDRSRRRHHRSASGCSSCSSARPTIRRTTGSRARIPDQSGARRSGPAAARVADQHARAHLRARRHLHPRQPRALRRAALRPAAAGSRRSRATSSGG